MKNLIGGTFLGLLLALASVFIYERFIKDNNLPKPINPWGIKTIIGISGTVMEGAVAKAGAPVKVMDATVSSGVQLKTANSIAGGTYTIPNGEISKSAILTYADIGKNYVIAYLQFPPASGTVALTEPFDFANTVAVNYNRFEIVLNGAADAYGLRLIENNGSNPQVRTYNRIEKGVTTFFTVDKKATSYTLEITPIHADGTTGNLILKQAWISKLPKEAIIYVNLDNLPL